MQKICRKKGRYSRTGLPKKKPFYSKVMISKQYLTVSTIYILYLQIASMDLNFRQEIVPVTVFFLWLKLLKKKVIGWQL